MLHTLQAATSKNSTPAWQIGWVLIAFAAAIVLPLLGAAYFVVLAIEDNEKERRDQHLAQSIALLGRDLDTELSHMVESLEMLATSPALAANDYAAFRMQAKAASDRLQANRLVVFDRAMNETVDTLMPVATAGRQQPRETREIAALAMSSGRPRVSDLFTETEDVLGPGAAQWHYQIVVPRFERGQVSHLLLVTPPAHHLRAILESRVPSGALATVTDRNGLIVAEAGSRHIRAPVITANQPLSMAGWQLHLQQTGAPADPLLQMSRRVWIFGGLGTLLLAGLLAVVLGRRLSQPIHTAAEAALLVGRGETLPRLRHSSIAEANVVIEALSQASTEISQRTRALKRARNEARRRAKEAEEARDEARQRAREAEEAKALLQTLLDHVPEGITIVSGPPDFTVIANSRMAEEHFGSEHALMKLPPSERTKRLVIYRPDGLTRARPEELPLYRASRLGEAIQDEEWIVERSDGSRILCAVNVAPIRNAKGELIGAINCWRDITERKKEEARLREATVLAKAVSDATPALIYVMDREGRLTSANPATLQALGKSASDVLGKSVIELLGDRPDIRQITANDQKVIETGSTLEFEELIERDGSTRHYLSTKSPVFGHDRDVIALVGVSVDITDRKRSESAAQLLSDIDHELAELSDPHEIVMQGTAKLGAYLGLSRCQLTIVERESGTITTMPGFLDRSASLAGARPISSYLTPEFYTALSVNEMIVVNDVKNDVRAASLVSTYVSFEIGAFVIRPLMEGGRLRAYLCAHSASPREWREDAISLIREVAGRIWSARSRALAEAALRTSEERYRLAAQAIQGMIFDWDLVTGTLQRSLGLEALIGIKPADAAPTIEWWRERCHPEDLTKLERAARETIAEQRTHIVSQYRVRHRDGYWVHVADRGHILYARDGTPVRWVGSIVDVTGQMHAEARLRESEERFRALVEASAQTVWTTNAAGEVEEDSPSWRAFTGQTLLQFLGWGWLDALHPQDRARSADMWRRAVAGERSSSMEYRLRHGSGEWRWTQARAVPLLAPDGSVRAWVAMTTDITDRKRWEEQQRLLLSELSHRVKNVLAVVQAMATRTLSGGRSLSEASDILIKRLHALSRAHDMLTTRDWQGAPLRAIVEGEFTPFAGRARIEGPEIMIGPRMAQTLALVLHELATNAIKYGALSNANGQVLVKWSVEGEGTTARFRFQWKEVGGPPVAVPIKKGFGTALLTMAISGTADALSPIRFEPEGLVYEIDVPLSSVS